MRLIKNKTKFNVVKYMPMLGGISLTLVVLSLILMFTKGIKYGLDFKGGIEIQVKFQDPLESGKVREALEKAQLPDVSVQAFGEVDSREYLIRVNGEFDVLKEVQAKIENSLKVNIPNNNFEFRRTDVVGPRAGKELRSNAFWAVVISLLLIGLYVAFRFEPKFAPGASLCLVHDVIVTLGAFVVLGKEVDVSVIAALLTLIGYSINDTIVVYDRIRENLRLMPGRSLGDIINASVNQTLSRTMLTSLTVLIVLIFLLIFGGPILHSFSFALFFGIIIGTYSSVFVAAPITILIDKYAPKKK